MLRLCFHVSLMSILLPEELYIRIWFLYYDNHVLKELKKRTNRIIHVSNNIGKTNNDIFIISNDFDNKNKIYIYHKNIKKAQEFFLAIKRPLYNFKKIIFIKSPSQFH